MLQSWITDLSCCGSSVPDYFEVDHDSTPSYTDLRNLRATAHSVGIKFALLLWAGPNANNSTNDADWYAGVMTQGSNYHFNDVVADLYDVTSWLHTPRTTIPEDTGFSFMYSVKKLIRAGYIAYPSLDSGQLPYPNTSVSDVTNCFHLWYQGDGNLVLYDRNGTPTWASNTSGTSAGNTPMQSDGNLVVYDASQTPVWNSQTWGHPGAYLIVQPDGNLVVYSDDYLPLWNSGTALGGSPCF